VKAILPFGTCALGGIVSGTEESSTLKWLGGKIRARIDTIGEVFLFPRNRIRRP
jgi:hypothetical protein